MKTFAVEFQQTTYTRTDVKARNKDEAMEKAFKKWQDAEYVREGDPDVSQIWEVK